MKRKLIKFLRRLFDTSEEGSSIPTTPVLYVDKEGANWYDIADVLSITADRYIALQVAQEAYSMKLSSSALVRFLDKIEAACNEGKIVDVFWLVKELRLRNGFLYEKESLCGFIALHYLYKDEKVSDYDPELQKEKVRILMSDREAFTFFLRQYFVNLKNLETSYVDSLLTYLDEIQKLMRKT